MKYNKYFKKFQAKLNAKLSLISKSNGRLQILFWNWNLLVHSVLILEELEWGQFFRHLNEV